MNAPVTFPASSIPTEASHARLLGLYPQRQEGLWMQRVRVPGGWLTGPQWATLAGIAQRLTPDEPLHLTTRQDLEIHGLSDQAVPEAQQLLAQADLTGLGACGDTIRNVVVCPSSGVAPNAPDLLPLAQRLTELLRSQAGAFAMPRKFKISLSACNEGCAQPWINDLGFVVDHHDEGWKFRVVVAGSLGAKPATGIPYGPLLEPSKVLPFVLAAFRVFAAHGDREHRHTARLRHVRQRMGDAAFLELLNREFAAACEERIWPSITLAGPEGSFTARKLLRFEDGNLGVDAAAALGVLAGRDDLRVRIVTHHQVAVFARDRWALDAALAGTHLGRVARPGPRVVACPGTRWCSRALADTARLAAAVRQRLNASAAEDLLIAISGCPNGCAHSAVGDVGAVGGLTGSKANRQEAWKLSVGGERGMGPGLAQPLARRLSLDEAAARIVELAVEASIGQSDGNEVKP